MSDQQLALFEYHDGKVRTVIKDGEVWFIAADIAAILEIINIHSSLALLDQDEKDIHTVDTPGGKQNLIIISESGFYSLVLRSRKPEAVNFKKWVTREVLPTIRKTGSYGTTEQVLSPMLARFQLNAQKNSVLGYWSMLNKVVELFSLPLELAGLTLPVHIVPDISTGKGFCDYLRSQGIDPDKIVKKYTHTYLDGRQVPDVNQYPDIYYPMFTDWLKNVWIKEKCATYLLSRLDKVGIAALPHLLKAFPNQIDAIPLKYLANYDMETGTIKQDLKQIVTPKEKTSVPKTSKLSADEFDDVITASKNN